MKLDYLKYTQTNTGWNVDGIEFSDLSLLVGLSGVGKTRILKTIHGLTKVAAGGSMDGAKWELRFTIDDIKYTWTGEYESKGYTFKAILDENESNAAKPKILTERLITDTFIIAERNDDEITFKGNKTPKLSPEVSILKLFEGEDDLKSIKTGFEKVFFIDGTTRATSEYLNGYFESAADEEIKTIEDLCLSKSNIGKKLKIASDLKLVEFDQLIDLFKEVFPFIEEVKIDEMSGADIPRYFKDESVLQFREKGVDSWIPIFKISSGMEKTFNQIATILFSPKDSVFLIDEFENSLGANCVDYVTDYIAEASQSSQFILTSHHPVVVNTIDTANWKIVSRRGGAVNVSKAPELGIGKSFQDSYLQLMNSILNEE